MKNSKKNSIKNQYRIFGIISIVILSIYTISILFPLLWAVLSSLKGRFDFRTNIFGLPEKWMWSNYIDSFSKLTLKIIDGDGYRLVNFGMQLLNTIIITVVMTFVTIVSRLVPAYMCAKYKCVLTRIMFNVNIILMIFPIIGTLAAALNFVHALGVYDTIWVLVLLNSGFDGSNFLIFYAVYKGVAWDYAEAAQLDGAGHFMIFLKIMLPMASSTIMALSILAVIGWWNAYDFNITYLPSMPVLAFGLFKYQTSPASGMTIPMQLAGAILTSIPSVLLFSIFRKKIMGNIAIGGLKG